MPTPEERHLHLAEDKLRRMLSLADKVLSIRLRIQQRINQQVGGFETTLRNRVLIGLNIKALDSFDRLLIDAREKRAECSHHLKTMAECFIYSGWVSGDTGDTRARLLCADGYRARVAYHERTDERGLADDWRELQNDALAGLHDEWNHFPTLDQIAIQANRQAHYNEIYRLACEAAHASDIFVYMPPQPEEPGLRFPDQSLLRAFVCLKFGIILACDLLDDASDSLGIGIGQVIEDFRAQWRTIIALGTDDPSGSGGSPRTAPCG